MRTLALFLIAIGAGAQSWDNSANSRLQGSYNFRYLAVVPSADNGSLQRRVAISGVLDFDGQGAYNLRATVFDSTTPGEQPFTFTGQYSLAPSGRAVLTNPAQEGALLQVVVANDVLLGSSTEHLLNDTFIAVKGGGTLSGRYWMAEIQLGSNAFTDLRNLLVQLNASGTSLGNLSVSGFIGSGNRLTQAVNGASFAQSGGVTTLTFPGTASLLNGTRVVYVAASGDLFIGGSANGANLTIGIRAATGAVSQSLFEGLYLQTGMDVDIRDLPRTAAVSNYFGAIEAAGGTQLAHQRLLKTTEKNAYDLTFADPYELDAAATFTDYLGFRNLVGANGAYRLSFGQEDYRGLSLAVKTAAAEPAPFTLNPSGFRNAASFSPFTTGIAPGALFRFTGSALASGPNDAVEASVNGKPAPVRAVTPEAVTVQIPFGLTDPIARIKLTNGSGETNEVVTFVNQSAPGVFTIPPAGFGYADAAHADGTKVTKQSPARPGETIAVFLTGLGAVEPVVADGVETPAEPLSKVRGEVFAYLDGEEAPVTFAGLAPGLVAIYKVELKVPDNAAPGDLYLDIAAPAAYTSQAQIPVAGKAGSMERDAGVKRKPVRGRGLERRPRP